MCPIPVVVGLAVIAATCVGCSKGEDDTSAATAGSRAKSMPASPRNAAAAIPAFAKINLVDVFVQVREGSDAPMTDFSGSVDMKSAYIGWLHDEPFLVMANEPASCDIFKPIQMARTSTDGLIKVSLRLDGLKPDQQSGAAPVKGTTIAVKRAVVFAKGFNRMVESYMGVRTNGLRFDSGALIPGEVVTGSFHLHEKDRAKSKRGPAYKGAMAKGSSRATVCEKFVKQLPKKHPLPAALGPCPGTTSLTAFQSRMDISKDGPFDLASFTIAKARWKDDGATLEVYVANGDWTAAYMGAGASPVKQNGRAFVTVRFYQKDVWVTIGDYKRGGDGIPFSASTQIGVKGRTVYNSFPHVVAKIVDMRGGKVCGTFEFKSKQSHLAGTFVADLPER